MRLCAQVHNSVRGFFVYSLEDLYGAGLCIAGDWGWLGYLEVNKDLQAWNDEEEKNEGLEPRQHGKNRERADCSGSMRVAF